jgi:CHAT domain-containing protein
MSNVPIFVWALWLFALWWLYVAGRDYSNSMSPRYKNGSALFLALVAAGALAGAGYLLLQALTPVALVLLAAFGVIWLLWLQEASAFNRLFFEGRRLFEQGRFEEAYEPFQLALQLAESRKNARQKFHVCGALGGVRFAQGCLEEAIKQWEEALALAEKYDWQKDIAVSCGLLGDAFLSQGFISKAQSMLKQSLEKSRDKQFWSIKAHTLQNLASIYAETGEGQKAIKALEDAHALYKQHRDFKQAAGQLSNQGRVYRLLCDYPQSVRCSTRQQALEYARAKCDEAYRFYESWLQHQGYWKGHSSNVVPLEIREYRDLAANQLGSIADTYRLTEQWTKATEYYELQREVGRGISFLEDLSGLALCYLELGEQPKAFGTIKLAFEINERDQQRQDPRTEYLLYFRRGYLHEKTGQMDKACQDYQAAMDRLGSLRQRVNREQNGVLWQRIGLLTQSERGAAARQLILLLFKRACEDKDKAWQEAFNVLERSRSQALLVELSRGGISLEQPNNLNFKEVQSYLPSGIVMAEYFTIDDKKTLLFGIRSNYTEPKIVELSVVQTELQGDLDRYFSDGKEVHDFSVDLEELWHKYDYLVEPIAQWAAPRDIVCLVPHGLLHRLPLHALKLEGQYLIERNPVVYNPSATVLKLCQSKRKNNSDGTPARQTAVIFGDSRGDRSDAREQAKRLAELFKVVPLLGNDVTKDAFRQNVVGKDIVHFVGHGQFDKAQPLNSGLQLTGKEVLTADEVFGLRGLLHAYLVTLSACETGINENRPGDELIGLTRAFLQIGTPSLLVSLWPVPQDSNAFLMEQFYSYLLNDPAILKVDALRQAMLETKNRPDKPLWASFYHWAPFVLVGDWQ